MMSYGNFNRIVKMVYEKSPFQKKKLTKYLSSQDNSFFESAESFSTNYLNYLESENIAFEYAIEAYLKMCSDMMKSQISFLKTGCYPVELADEVFDSVYNDEKTMKSYMVGLAISQFLWPTHYRMFSFFKNHLINNRHSISSYIEIGPGHGLFLSEAMSYLDNAADLTVVDISPVAMEMTKSIMQCFHNAQSSEITYKNVDILKLDLNRKYDFITMGEVLEHVNHPENIIEKLTDLLAEDGRAYISTCVDCPTIDHVFHYKSVDEIRDMLDTCGLSIYDEKVLPVEDLPMDEIVRKKITINYCAMVTSKRESR